MGYVYIRSEANLWTVGFYDPRSWQPESDHGSRDEAAERVRWLNGGEERQSVLTPSTQEARRVLLVNRPPEKEMPPATPATAPATAPPLDGKPELLPEHLAEAAKIARELILGRIRWEAKRRKWSKEQALDWLQKNFGKERLEDIVDLRAVDEAINKEPYTEGVEWR